jgi:hypothetical protein
MLEQPEPKNEEQLTRAVLRLNGSITGLALGFLTGLVIFSATAFLVIKGGRNVGQHLQLLSQFFIGYTVTWPGSFVGLFYGFLTGYFAGWIVAGIYNGIVARKERETPRV